MIDRDFLESLVRLLDESSLDNLEIERGGTRIRLSKSPSGGSAASPGSATAAYPPSWPRPPAAPAAPAAQGPSVPTTAAASESAAPPDAESPPGLLEIASPMVGTFYRAPSPEADPFVETGDSVKVGDVLCVIEAMKLMNELECETPGRIVEVCVGNAEPVDFGQVLFRVAPA